MRAMFRARSSTALAAWIALCVGAGSAGAQPSGSVTFSGPGAALVPSTTFIPASFASGDGSWNFADEGEVVGILVAEMTTDATRAAFVAVAVDGGANWVDVGLTGIPGVTIGMDTITFQDVVLPQGSRESADLVLNGALTRPVSPVSPVTWGRVKSLYSGG